MMADELVFSLAGADALNAKLAGLRNDVRYKGGRFALRKAANLVRDDAIARATRLDDEVTGRKIADNVVTRWSGKHFKQTGNLKFRIGVKGGGKTGRRGNPDTGVGGKTPHWHLLEFGTSKMAAQPFMRPALAENVQAASNEFVKQYGKAIDRAIRRAEREQRRRELDQLLGGG